jgi:hypothetical protein
MGRYYNRGRGNVALTLTGGRAFSAPGNTWFDLEGPDETTVSVMRSVKKGLLFRQPSPVAEAESDAEVKTSASPADEEATAPTAGVSPKPGRAASPARK